MSSNTILKLDNVSFSYGKSQVLKDISFAIAEGEFVALVGSNGVGKSTILKIMNRICRDYSGIVSLFDRDLVEYSQKEVAQKISYVPQFLNFDHSYSVYDFLSMSCYPYSSRIASLDSGNESKISTALEVTNTKDLVDRLVDTLSGGERQKILIAASIVQDSSVIMLDEPTAFLDPLHEYEICKLLLHLNKDMGKTIIVVTHSINHAVSWNRRIIALKNGEVVYDGESRSIIDNSILKKIYDKDFIIMKHPHSEMDVIVPEIFDES